MRNQHIPFLMGEPAFGEILDQQVLAICAVANALNRVVIGSFNGTCIIATPGATVDELLIKWTKDRGNVTNP